ncbi:hypothetical protein ACF07T_34510 [Streptomyces sp. NPDC015184]|uniref:hypothetical protein n=1 Tax=Streptomyces sp. NPDC015184 TaxID=3364946 RepID=UPI0036FEF58C
MAKQRVTVCVPPCAPEDLHRFIGRAMAPFDYNRTDHPDPDWVGEWDYWFVSGAGCLFAVLPGHEQDPRLVRRDEWTEPPVDPPPSRCHGGPRGLLDLAVDRDEAAARARVLWKEYQEFATCYPPALPYGFFATRAHTDPVTYPRERVVEEFTDQPLIRALVETPDLGDRFASDPVAYFGEDLETFVAQRVAEVLPTPTLLTLDGRWIESGGPEYLRMFNEYLESLPADTMVVRVLYHS